MNAVLVAVATLTIISSALWPSIGHRNARTYGLKQTHRQLPQRHAELLSQALRGGLHGWARAQQQQPHSQLHCLKVLRNTIGRLASQLRSTGECVQRWSQCYLKIRFNGNTS